MKTGLIKTPSEPVSGWMEEMLNKCEAVPFHSYYGGRTLRQRLVI